MSESDGELSRMAGIITSDENEFGEPSADSAAER